MSKIRKVATLTLHGEWDVIIEEKADGAWPERKWHDCPYRAYIDGGCWPNGEDYMYGMTLGALYKEAGELVDDYCDEMEAA